MTSITSTTNKEKKTTSFLGFNLKQYWTSILLFTIILFFVLPVPVMMYITNEHMHGYSSFENIKNELAVYWVEAIRYVIIPIMSVISVVVSAARFSYLKNKVSVDFFHSLPIRRERLFFTQLGVGALAIIVPYLINILFTFIVIASNGLITGALVLNVALLTAELAVYVLFFYSLSTLVGMVCGLTAVQLVLTAVAIFILPVAHALFITFIDIFVENMWVDFYLSENIMEKLSLAIRFVVRENALSLAETIILIVISAAMLGLSLFLYTRRKSERAGQSVVFNPLAEVIKYVIMFIGTLAGGTLFYYIMNDMFWTFFGMACGMVLTFMLANTVIHKTAKAMFRGVRGLIIFAGTTLITVIILMTNAFGVNSRVPSPSATSKVEVRFGWGQSSFEFTDRAVIEAIHRIYTERNVMHEVYDSNIVRDYESFNLQVAFYNRLGIPTAKTVYIGNKSDFIEEFRTILNSEEFGEQYALPLKNVLTSQSGRAYFSVGNGYYINDYGRVWSLYETHNLNNEQYEKFMLGDIARAAAGCNFDYFQHPVFGRIGIYEAGYRYGRSFSLHTTMASVEEGYVNLGVMRDSYEEATKKLVEAIDEIKICRLTDKDTGLYLDSSAVITDKEQIKALLEASTNIYGNYYDSLYTFVDTEYFAVYELTVTDDHGNDYIDMSEEELANHFNTKSNGYYMPNTYTREFDIAFILGKTPDFVPGLFTK